MVDSCFYQKCTVFQHLFKKKCLLIQLIRQKTGYKKALTSAIGRHLLCRVVRKGILSVQPQRHRW